MKTVGIQIDGNKMTIGVIEKYDDGNMELSELSRRLELLNHLDNTEVRNFKDELYSALDIIGATRIAYVARNPKGQKSASPLSFKLEGILQLYPGLEVESFWPATTSAFYKKNNYKDLKKYKYQDKALRLATYLIEND
tara:strand:+ start:5094 stop:5507 length:414 start_codon:yes stop_codon:yes gene_type:complete